MTPVSASVLVRALATKHQQDVFVPECKNGPTQTGSHLRLDAWALKKTWSPVTIVGYEVKVDRSDWKTDAKYVDYMAYCHQLYVVAPKGLVRPDEVPLGVGLIEAVGATHKLVTRRPAPRRDLDARTMFNLFVYVLMARTKIVDSTDDLATRSAHYQMEQLQRWAASKEDRIQLHYALGRKIHAAFDQQEARARALDTRIRALEQVERRVAELGFDVTQPVPTWQVDAKLRALSAVVNPQLLRTLRQTAAELLSTEQALAALGVKPVLTPGGDTE